MCKNRSALGLGILAAVASLLIGCQNSLAETSAAAEADR